MNAQWHQTTEVLVIVAVSTRLSGLRVSGRAVSSVISLQLATGTLGRQLRLEELGVKRRRRDSRRMRWTDWRSIRLRRRSRTAQQSATRSTDLRGRAGVIAQDERMLERKHLTGGRMPWCGSKNDGGLEVIGESVCGGCQAVCEKVSCQLHRSKPKEVNRLEPACLDRR